MNKGDLLVAWLAAALIMVVAIVKLVQGNTNIAIWMITSFVCGMVFAIGLFEWLERDNDGTKTM